MPSSSRARVDELAHLALLDPDERAFEPQHELLGCGHELQLGGAAHDLGEPRVRLQLGDRRRVAELGDDAVDELRHCALLDHVLAERRQDVARRTP